MIQYFVGDELGQIKLVSCTPSSTSAWTCESTNLDTSSIASREKSISKLTIHEGNDDYLLYAAKADGTLSRYSFGAGDGISHKLDWKENRFGVNHVYVGLRCSSDSVYWCTSHGAVGRHPIDAETEIESSDTIVQKATLPMRLKDWQLSPTSDTFAYGGDEVDLSVWSVDLAFSQQKASELSSKKRKYDRLLPAEIWRAKNLPNDSLGLRQPVQITSLTYLKGSSTGQNHILTASQNGTLRRYDVRADRRSIAEWKIQNFNTSLNLVTQSSDENEIYFSDNVRCLGALDLRNGRTLYTYKDLTGAITSISPGPGNSLASTARDRYMRIHRTTSGFDSSMEKKPYIACSVYMKTTPTFVLYDPRSTPVKVSDDAQDDVEENEMWEKLASATKTIQANKSATNMST